MLSHDLPSTLHILEPFLPWGNCTLLDTEDRRRRGRVKYYSPMESYSIAKSTDMPAVGALFPFQFSERGYWWWKAQEVTYALRPKDITLEALETKMNRHSHVVTQRAVFQIRRTDKTEGCNKVYGR